jgi:trimethylamine---corrinoid protein Co-methyltransferase
MRLTTDGRVLDDHEADAVIEAALAILERTGVRVEHAGILDRLAACGATVDPARQVARFPLAVMTDFLAASRRREPPDGTVRFSGCVEIYEGRYLDPADGTYRRWTERTLLDYVRLARALPSVGAASMLGLPLDSWPRALQPLTEKLFAWKWGIQGGNAIWDAAFCPRLHRMWCAWADHVGQDVRGLFNGTVYLVSPLRFAAAEAEQYAWFAGHGLEVNVGLLGSLGGTVPVTPAGALALQTAEGLFLNVLRRASFGHRDLRLGTSLSVVDMRTGCFQYGRPEQTLLNLAGAAVARRLGAGHGGHGGLSDAREPGYEAAAQKVASAAYLAQATGHGSIACGLLAVDEVFSPEQLVLDAEALSWLQRLSEGVDVDAEALAVEAIAAAGWGGDFLSSDHTARHFARSLWQPSVFSTESFARWSAGGSRGQREAVRDRVRDLLAAAPPLEPQMPARLERQLLRIIEE